jgi:hypothetical protein
MYGPLIIRKVGNSLTVTISDIAKDLGLGEGDKLFAMRTPRGAEFTPYDGFFEKALDTAPMACVTRGCGPAPLIRHLHDL